MKKLEILMLMALVTMLVAGCSGTERIGAKHVSSMLDENLPLTELLDVVGAKDSAESLKVFFGVSPSGSLLELSAEIEPFMTSDARRMLNQLNKLDLESIKHIVKNSEDLETVLRGAYYALRRVRSFDEFEPETRDDLVEVLYLLGEFDSIEEVDQFAVRLGVEKDVAGVKRDLFELKNIEISGGKK